jgi:hypothetical protein
MNDGVGLKPNPEGDAGVQLAKANCNRYLLPLALADGNGSLCLSTGFSPTLAIIDLSKISKNCFVFNNLCFF